MKSKEEFNLSNMIEEPYAGYYVLSVDDVREFIKRFDTEIDELYAKGFIDTATQLLLGKRLRKLAGEKLK